MNIAKCKKRLESQGSRAVGLFQGIFHYDMIFLLYQHTGFCENDSPYPVGYFWYRVNFKIPDILMTFRLIKFTRVFMNAQIELGIMLYHCFIK